MCRSVETRRILVDHARNRSSIKRGRGWKRIKIEDIGSALGSEDFDWMAIDAAAEAGYRYAAEQLSANNLT